MVTVIPAPPRSPYAAPKGVAGRYYDLTAVVSGGAPTPIALVSDFAHTNLLYVPAGWTIDRLAVEATVAAAGGKLIKFLIHEANQSTGQPTTLALASSSVAADATGKLEATVAYTAASSKWVHLGVVSDGTPTLTSAYTGNRPLGRTLVTDAIYRGAAYLSSFAAPVDLTAVAAVAVAEPIIAWRAA